MSSKNRWIVAIVLVVLIGGAYFYHRHTNTANQTTYRTATATKQTITASVSGSGNVIVAKTANINPSITGTVNNLTLHVGDQVKRGQTLFTIDNPELNVTASKSFVSYLQAKQAVQNAQSSLAQAQQTLANDQIDSGQSKALVALDQAKQTLLQDQADLAALQAKPASTVPDSTLQIAQQKVTTDQDNVNAVSIAYQQSTSGVNTTTQSAQNAVSGAQVNLQAAQKNVDASLEDYNFQQAQANLRTVTSPIDGTVTEVNVQSGDQLGRTSSASTTGTTASSNPMVIEDLTSLQATVQINEIDVPRIQKQQKATLTFDAVSGLSLVGTVQQIDTAGTVSQGVVTYSATVSFDALDPRVKPQMSVSAAITTDVKQDALIVPNSAVKSDNTGQHYVDFLVNGAPERHNVEIGLTNDTDTEITNGISENDTVITQTITPTSAPSAASSSGLRIPGLTGGGFGGGGGGARTGAAGTTGTTRATGN